MDVKLKWENRVFIFEAKSEAGREFLTEKARADGIDSTGGRVVVIASMAVPIIEGIINKGLEVA